MPWTDRWMGPSCWIDPFAAPVAVLTGAVVALKINLFRVVAFLLLQSMPLAEALDSAVEFTLLRDALEASVGDMTVAASIAIRCLGSIRCFRYPDRAFACRCCCFAIRRLESMRSLLQSLF